MKPEITVILATADDQYLDHAISHVLNQSFKNFELILVNDKPGRKLKDYKDKRIRIINNKKNLGIAKSRNVAINVAKGNYIFFTDDDCEPEKDWLKEGLKTLKQTKAIGVEGYTYYLSENYQPKIEDKLPGTLKTRGHYMGCNLGYTKKIMKQLKGFDEKYKYHDDREFAIRAKEKGEIAYCKEMRVKHLKKIWTPKSYIKSGTRAHDRVILFKYHNEKHQMLGRLMYPKELLKILIPPLILFPLLKGKCNNWNCFLLLLSTYPKAIYQRYNIWKNAIKEKIFVF